MNEKPIIQLTPTLIHVDGKALGRHRLVNWPKVARLIRSDSTPIATVDHSTNLSTCLDQGNLGSCTGNATAHCASSQPFSRKCTETEAVTIYSRATADDQFPGTYPPTDTGSTGYFAMQAACELGYFQTFAMCVGLTAVLQALQSRAGITGMDWYEGYDTPDANGLVAPTGQIRGGHEICLIAVDVVLGSNGNIDPDKSLVWFQNSWGKGYGVRKGNRDGCFCMTLSDYELSLAAGGDATFPALGG